MPVYAYQCVWMLCRCRFDAARRVAERDGVHCPKCGAEADRVFTPTANIHIGEHFRHLQSDFMPPKGDPSWEYLGRDDQLHAPPKEDGLKEHLLDKFAGRLGS